MKLIDRTDIEGWASRYESKGNLPYLISRLVWVTALPSVQINIPSGSAANIGGWDGVVESEDERSYVPAGISLWEFGTESAVKGKADSDYEKRTLDPLGYNPKNCTFIFVTPRLWSKKDKWVQNRMTEGKWKDIKVYDSVDLEQWLDHSKPVATWFATQVGRLPFDGVLTADQFWQEWSVGPRTILAPETVTSGRENEMNVLFAFLRDQPGIKAVKASTKTEAIAFIIAAAKQLPVGENELFFSKTLLIDTEGSYRALHTNSKTPINLIPKFKDTTPLYAAVSGGHHVIVPLGGDDTINQDLITLPTIRKEGQISGLMANGLEREEAESYSKEAGRDITILRKLLKFPHSVANWFKNENFREIVPALLMGRWDSNSRGDKEILEKLSGKSYTEYIEILTKWRDFEESPILQIGDTWRLTSPLDLWTTLSGILTGNDFKLLAEVFLLAYKDNDIDNHTDSGFIRRFSKPKKYSSWAREGLAQSLILIAQYGTGLEISKIKTPQYWVDDLITELMSNIDSKQWISMDQKLPLLSEASPSSFIKALYDALKLQSSPILEMFSGGTGLLGSNSNHTGLLWALEGLAWLPEYLYDSTVLLLKLSAIDPGGNLSNRPDNSLAEIYKPWHHQTLAPFEERMEILKQSIKVEKEQGWKLLIRMLPKGSSHASPTHKMRWRLFEKNTNLQRTYKEIDETHSYVLDLLIQEFDNKEEKFVELIAISTTLRNGGDNDKILSFIESVYKNIEHNQGTARNQIRKILSKHRTYLDAAWSLPEEILERYEKIYLSLEPESNVSKYKWLFESHHIEFPDGKFKDEDTNQYKAHFERVERVRISALKAIINDISLSDTIEFADTVSYPIAVGEALAKILEAESDIFLVVEALKKDKPNLALVHSFVTFKVIKDGLDWAFRMFHKMSSEGFNDEQLSQILIPLDHSTELWDFIDLQNDIMKEKFWEATHPRFYHNSLEEKLRGINYLLKYKRFYTAIDTIYLLHDEIPSEFIAKALEMAATQESIEKITLKEYEVSTLFEQLDKSDMSQEEISKLEWLYLPILGSYGTKYKPKYLHKELASRPESLVQVLKWVYMPKDENLREEERKNISEDVLRSYAEKGYRLLNDFKTIPGSDENGSIDANILNQWVDTVRTMAAESDRLEVADMQIGKLLASYSERNKDYWPPDEISEILERINTKSIMENFSVSTTNKRGFSSRGPYDGGDIERNHAAHFSKLSEIHKIKHPNLSKIFKDISLRYIAYAKHEDEQAERDRLEY